MISAIVITKNEQERIVACLESLKWVDEIIIADNGSSDKTLEVAQEYTNNIIKFEGQDFAALRNESIKKAKGDWVLYVDADERVLAPLRDEIQKLISETEKSAFALSRINVIFGERVNYGPYKKDWMIRLFKKSDFESWVGKVHEYGKFKGELGYTENSLLHLTHRDLDHFMGKALEWSRIDAQLRVEAKHPMMNKLRFIRVLFTESFNQLIKRGGIFNGTVGLVDSVLQVFSFFFTYVRLWELQKGKPLNKIYDEIDKRLIEGGFKF